MKPKRHSDAHVGAGHLVQGASIEHQQITGACAAIEHDAQQHSGIFAAVPVSAPLQSGTGIGDKNGFAGGVSLPLPQLVPAPGRRRVEFDDCIQ